MKKKIKNTKLFNSISILKFGYAPVNLNVFTELEDKFETVFNYLDIISVFCKLESKYDPDFWKTQKYFITEIAIPGGTPSYIQDLVREIREKLAEALNSFLDNAETDIYDMKQILRKLKDNCILRSKVHDITNSMEYRADSRTYLSYTDTALVNIYSGNLAFTPAAREELHDHFYLRKVFYKDMAEIVDRKTDVLNEVLPYDKKPYKWVSENAHYEIAELLFALIDKRIEITDKENGSTAKLVKDFYNLFGLDDGLYHQKVQQLKKKKNKESWLHELTKFIDGLHKKNNSSKN